ncbi:MAG: InlB B-repeat-containing protein [Clostridia bacterium]|nr:InlB B-repeat-containing protein [Clostridia bacterium]
MKKHAKKIITALLVITLLIPTVAMLVSNAAETTTVELAFNNVFVFEKWANNSLSPTPILDGVALSGDAAKEAITTDIANGSFTLTKTNMDAGELYTAFSMDSANAAGNEDYYMMDVEPNTSYTFTYNVSGDLWAFTPFVFMYTDQGLFAGTDSMVAYATPGYGINSFSFTTPANVTNIQVRFTIGDNSSNHSGVSSVYANVSDIAIYKTELYDTYVASKNLFSLEGWASNSLSSAPIDSNTGTITTDTVSETVTFTTAATADTYLWSGNAVLNSSTAYTDYYSIDVEPNTSYTLTYSVIDHNLTGPTYCQPWIVEYSAEGQQTALFNYEASGYLNNKKVFTTNEKTVSLQVVFAVINDSNAVSRTCTVSDIGVYTTSNFSADFETITGHPHRQTYEASTGTYGELPTPTNVPVGMVFAGWYTAPNGSGERITAETDVSYRSYTVYPKYEVKVDTLEVVTLPAKTTYTLGEKFNPAGLVLKATVANADGTVSTVNVNSGYYCTPEYLTATGEQTITAHYGGQTATFTVTVNASENKSVTVNNVVYDNIAVANNEYTFNYTTSSFNRYEITYYSDSYVRGIITFDDDTTEEFFLEPSNSGRFASYIDNFLANASHIGVKSIKFTCLNKEFGKVELYSLTTISAAVPTNSVQYFENEKYKVGIDLAFGGVISYIECLEGATDGQGNVMAARYTGTDGNTYTKVDYKDKLPAGAIDTVESVNLINTWDRGRYLQQSYYGTDQPPFVMGDYNGVPWNYNPVQGGNLKSTITNNGGEASKVIDYRITGSQIYVKTRPLDWGKNSVDYADDPAWNTPSYMEAWYTFTTDGKGLIQGTCRFVDYSGYPSNTTTQEFPALYTVEPLNHFVYNEVTEENAWAATQDEFKADAYSSDTTTTGAQNIAEPDFWGVLPSYNQYNPDGPVDPDIVAHENWAAFTASEDKDSFGIGIYSPGVTDIHYGCFVAKYDENQYKAKGEQGAEADGGYIVAKNAGTEGSYTHVENYRHASTLDPAVEMNTSYIAPINTLTFDSYTPITYTYYVSTGTADEIREDFRLAKETEENAQKEVAKIAVPETVYMTPVADGATYTTIGQNYVNNALSDLNVVYTVAEPADNMYFGMYALDAKEFSVNVTNVTDPSNEIDFYNLSSSASAEGELLSCTDSRYRADDTYGLRFTGTGLKHGEMATAKWEITVTLNDGSTETYTAYTVLYAPERTVGAVAEGRYNSNSMSEISSWITGATGVDHSQRAPLGSFHGDIHDSGYFRVDPLANPDTLPTGGSAETSNDYIITTNPSYIGAGDDADDYTDNAYVLQTATHDSDSSRAQSYLGLLAIDKSRYSNTNQIPNLKIGYDALRVGGYEKDSLSVYNNYYTLGTDASFASTDLSDTPSGWTTFKSYSELYGSNGGVIPYRETVVPSYAVSDDLDGKYIHAIAYGKSYNLLGSRYATAGTSVLLSVTDKSALRDSVLNGYSQAEENSSVATYPEFIEKLEDAATVLGDPTATQEEIDNAQTELDKITDKMLNTYYSLKYDNLFSAYEFSLHSNSMTVVADRGTASYNDGAITVVNDTITGGEAYTNYGTASGYYLIDLKPNTEYVFEYTSETTLKAQAFMFFYNSSGGAGDVPTNMSIKVNDGSWSPKSESNAWWGNYQNSAGTDHYAIKFTTGANTTKAGFRFGNTSNDPVTSTFSNIKLIDAAHYYEDVTYTKTESVHKEHTSYGTLQTLTRTGYTFGGWVDADGNTVTEADIATEHKSIYSVWNENSYTIVYNSNGGTGTVANQTATYAQSVKLASGGYVKSGYALKGWSTNANATTAEYQLGETVTGLTNVNGDTVNLYAVWAISEINVTFDNLINFNAWNKIAGNGVVSGITDTGFTITTNSGSGESTSESPEFPVTEGKQYIIDIDFVGDGWDVYIFFRNATQGGTGIDFSDSTNRFSSNGSGNTSQIFTAPAGATKAVIRVDSNGSNNSVSFDNIRVYEYDGISPIEVKPANKIVIGGETFGELPTPTKEGFNFVGWYDESGNQVYSTSTVPNDTDGHVPLTSKWQLADTALTEDTAVLDFGTPIVIDAYGNDTILQKAATAYGATGSINGVSIDGITYSTSVNGNYGVFNVEDGKVTYTPTAVINGVEKIYYQAQLSAVDTTPVENQISIVPASNILYEETVASSGNNGKSWSSDGTSTLANQTASDGIYGYDAAYLNNNTYSGGTAETVVLDYYSSRSATKSFEFTGDAFDLISACGKKTGAQIVTVRNSAGSIVKVYIVDTYYSDASIIDSDTGILYQVPIVSFRGDYDAYSVEVTAAYITSAMAFRSRNSAVTTYAVETDNSEIEASAVTVSDKEAIAEILAEVGMEDLATENVELVWFDDDSIFNGGTGAFLVSEPATENESVQMMASESGQLSVSVVYDWGNDPTYIPDTVTKPDGFVFYYTKGQTLTDDSIDKTYKSSTIVDIEGEDGIWKFSGWKIPNKGVIKSNPVVVTGKWTFYPELNYYFDGIRVYNPVADTSSYIASEQNAVYCNVINSLADGDIFTDVSGIAYVEGATFEEASFAEYQNKGPQNELYLTSGNSGVSFSVPLPEGAKVMLGVRAVSGSPKLTINGKAFEINTATEMYYDITQYLTATDGIAPIAITNTGIGGILAVNNIKFVGIATASVSTLSLDRTRALMAMEPVDVEYTLPGVSEPEAEEPTPDTDGDVDDNGTTDWIEVVISNIRSFFSDIFGYIKQIFELIISSVTAKEVF